MAQRLPARPLLTNLLISCHGGQPADPLGCLRPQPFDGVPRYADVICGLALAELHALGAPTVPLGADEIVHVDSVDRDIAEVTSYAHVGQPAVPDRDAGQLIVGEAGAAQVRDLEPGTPEMLAAAAPSPA